MLKSKFKVLVAAVLFAALSLVSCKKNEVIAVSLVEVEPSTLSLVVGQEQQLTATLYPKEEGGPTNKNVSWSVTEGTGVVEVDNNGKVKANAPGHAIVTVTTEDGGKTATCDITVTAATVPVTGISVSQSAISLEIGDTLTLTATVEPADATDKSVSWSSDKTAVATVDPSTGLVTAVGAGEATITATAGGETAPCTVTVTAPIPVEQLTLSKDDIALLSDDQYTLTVTILPAEASAALVWSVDDQDVAEISQDGVISAKAQGTTTVTVAVESDPTISAVCSVAVFDKNTTHLFTIGPNRKAVISPGNLWCDASDHSSLKWHFEESQYLIDPAGVATKGYDASHVSFFYRYADPLKAVAATGDDDCDYDMFAKVLEVDGVKWRMPSFEEFQYLVYHRQGVVIDGQEFLDDKRLEIRKGKWAFVSTPQTDDASSLLVLAPDDAAPNSIPAQFNTEEEWDEYAQKGYVSLPMPDFDEYDDIDMNGGAQSYWVTNNMFSCDFYESDGDNAPIYIVNGWTMKIQGMDVNDPEVYKLILENMVKGAAVSIRLIREIECADAQ